MRPIVKRFVESKRTVPVTDHPDFCFDDFEAEQKNDRDARGEADSELDNYYEWDCWLPE